jgi:hypothetical protein
MIFINSIKEGIVNYKREFSLSSANLPYIGGFFKYNSFKLKEGV